MLNFEGGIGVNRKSNLPRAPAKCEVFPEINPIFDARHEVRNLSAPSGDTWLNFFRDFQINFCLRVEQSAAAAIHFCQRLAQVRALIRFDARAAVRIFLRTDGRHDGKIVRAQLGDVLDVKTDVAINPDQFLIPAFESVVCHVDPRLVNCGNTECAPDVVSSRFGGSQCFIGFPVNVVVAGREQDAL